VDIAHRKPVSKFSDDTRVSEINDISNLAALCKNHHWEFDHGTLELPC
jgi:predicted restriction endonuclease